LPPDAKPVVPLDPDMKQLLLDHWEDMLTVLAEQYGGMTSAGSLERPSAL